MQISMQIKYDLCSLLENNKLSNIEGVRKVAEMKVTSFISKSKRWNPFQKGKNGRDLSSSELLILVVVWRTKGSQVSQILYLLFYLNDSVILTELIV